MGWLSFGEDTGKGYRRLSCVRRNELKKELGQVTVREVRFDEVRFFF